MLIRPLLFFLTLAFLIPAPAAAQLASLEVGKMRLVFLEGSEAFLIPHAARTFLNSLAFQKRLFDFTPTERITVLLTDFADAGGASANSVPRNNLAISIAPVNAPFETVTSNDRMNLIMNHELVHIVTLDQTARSDRMFRRLFSGKVLPVPGSRSRCSTFFSPRLAWPRRDGFTRASPPSWTRGWRAGSGVRRAASTRWCSARWSRTGEFYDPLGLVSEGTEVDFMLQTNSYLYGTRFMVWVARTFGPEKLVAWVARHDGGRAYYASEFERVFGISLDKAWALGGRWSSVSAGQPGRRAPVSPHAATDLTQQALGSVSRAFYDPRTRTVYAAFNYPGVVAHVGSIAADTGKVERLATSRGRSCSW